MKRSRYIYYFILLTILWQQNILQAQSGENPLVTQLLIYKGDTIFKSHYLYGLNNEKILETKYYRTGNDAWHRLAQTEWIYTNQRCTDIYYRHWDSQLWESYLHQKNAILETGDSLTQFFSIDGGIEKLESQIQIAFENGLKKQETCSFLTENGLFEQKNSIYHYVDRRLQHVDLVERNATADISQSRLSYHYTTFGKLDSLLVQVKIDEAWENASLLALFYNAEDGLKSAEFYKTWNREDHLWQNVQTTEYTYTPQGELFSEQFRYWKDNVWVNQLKYTYMYDNDKKLMQKKSYLSVFNDFRAASTLNYLDFQYGEAGLIESQFEFWGGEIGEGMITTIPFRFNNELWLTEAEKIEISYIPIDYTSVEDLNTTLENQILIYPNPSKALFYYQNKGLQIEQWHLLDVSGKLLLTHTPREKSGVVDLGDFKPGLYLLQIVTNKGIITKKLIKE